ncbi:retrovirus-related pol polyprotein from transposon TNT 1-94 [Tanacetum coccineum]
MSFSTGVIPTTSVSRPQLKSNQFKDSVMSNNSQGKKKEVEDHCRNFKFSNNKTFVTACNDSLNAKTSNVNFVCVTYEKCVLNENHDICVLHYINGVNSRTKRPIVMPISTREPMQTVNQSVATPLKRTVASESTNQKPRHTTRKLYEQVSKTCSWWYPKFTPSGYKWKPKSPIRNVNTNVSMPLGNASRTANILEPMILRCSTVSNTPLSSNSFAARAVTFRNDQIAPILGYGDLVQGTITIKRIQEVTPDPVDNSGPIFDAEPLQKVVEIILFIINSGCSKHMTGNLKLLTNFVEKFLGMVKFRNDQIASILGYRDLVQGTITIKRVYYVEGLNHNLFSVDQLCDADLEVAFTQNRSLVIPRHEKTPYHIINAWKPSVKFFHIFGSLCYIVRDGENLDKMKEKGDACIFEGYSTQSRAYRVSNKRTRIIVETIHVNFDELPQMASDHVSSDPVP